MKIYIEIDKTIYSRAKSRDPEITFHYLLLDIQCRIIPKHDVENNNMPRTFIQNPNTPQTIKAQKRDQKNKNTDVQSLSQGSED